MASFTVSLADVPIKIESLHDTTMRYCGEFITEQTPELAVSMTQADIDSERARCGRIAAEEDRPVPAYSDAYLETLALYRKLALALSAYDTVVFHGSAVAVDGRAYIFTAASGTGKTTHTRLWLKNIPGSYVVNGDKPLLRLAGDRVLVCGTPWRGKERFGCGAIVPVEAICLLERSAENRIEPIPFRDAVPMLVQQTHRPERADALRRTIDLIGRLDGRVRLYRLGCNMDDEAAFVSFRGMTGTV